MPASASSFRLPASATTLDLRRDAVPGDRLETCRFGQRQALRAGRNDGSPSGCSDPVSAAATSEQGVCLESIHGLHGSHRGLARVIVPVLSSTIVSILRAISSASPPRTRMPFSAALPFDHDRGRRGEAERARAGDDQTATVAVTA